jgi:glutathione synthase
MKRFAFIMDPLEKLDLPWDTSLGLLRELARRGHETVLFTLSSLSLSSGRVQGGGRLIQPLGNHRYRQGPKKEFDLARFKAVFIRKDPPFDSNYLALTYLLEPLAKQTVVINHPRGIRNANEKLFALSFPRWSPPTLVSPNAVEILAFQKKIRSDLVVKPLYEKGGKGISLLKRGARQRENLLRKATRGGGETVLAQKFIPLPKGEGDKRILLWKGKILGAFLRIPRPGEFRSNLSLGGRFESCAITLREKRLVSSLRSPLLREGLLFVGIDVRAGKLMEVNVTSPAGLVELEWLYGRGATRKLADDLERS